MAIGGREVAGQLDTFELMLCRSLIGAAILIPFGLAMGKMTEIRTMRLGHERTGQRRASRQTCAAQQRVSSGHAHQQSLT